MHSANCSVSAHVIGNRQAVACIACSTAWCLWCRPVQRCAGNGRACLYIHSLRHLLVPNAAGCPAGLLLSVTGCIKCKRPFYCPAGGRVPQQCPPDLLTVVPGAKPIQYCGEQHRNRIAAWIVQQPQAAAVYFVAVAALKSPFGSSITAALSLHTSSPNYLLCCLLLAAVLPVVNPPGYRYVGSSQNPSAKPCGPNTYSGGLKKQPMCSPCPAGSQTNPARLAGSLNSSAVCGEGPNHVNAGAALHMQLVDAPRCLSMACIYSAGM